MTTYAVLAEKPDMARKIVAGLGGSTSNHNAAGYIEVNGSPALRGRILVTYGVGHLIQLSYPDAYGPKYEKWSMDTLPILPAQFKTEVAAKTAKQYQNVAKVLKEANEIIIATDSDREGENIAYTIIDQAGQRDKVTKRLWINSNLPSAVAAGFHHLRDAAETYSYYKESHARSMADWLVGMNFTRFYTLKAESAGIRGSFSAGRVQTPVMALVAKNYLERKNFKPIPYVIVRAEAEKDGKKLTFTNATKYKTDAEAQADLDKNELENPYDGRVTKVIKEKKSTVAPSLFDLAGIQSYANTNWGYTNDKTLELVQKLYDGQWVTYPRTEETKVSEEEFQILLKVAPKLMENLQLSFDLENSESRKKYVGAYKAHSALMPTTKQPKLDQLSKDERHIYVAIAERTLMMFAADYEYDHTEVEVAAGDLSFKTTGNVPTKMGWKNVQKDDQEKDADKDDNRLPEFAEGEEIFLRFEKVRKETKPPKAYTPSSLGGKNSAMEKLNLGTSATRASIIKTVVDREYMVLKKNQYEPTEKGLLMYKLVKDSSIGSAEMTATWEERLHAIEENQEEPEPFMHDIKSYVTDELHKEKNRPLDADLVHKMETDAAKATIVGKCPKCKQESVKAKPNGQGYYCTKCDFQMWGDIAHKTLTKTEVKQLLATGKTKKKVTGMKGKKGEFDAFVTLDAEGKTGFAFK